MKFKVGDKVRVRKDLENGYFGIENLGDYQNDKIFTIKRGREHKFSGYVYELLEDNKINYDFKEDMLIPVEDELQERIKKYEDPEDLTLMFMYCDEKAKDKIKELQERINKAIEYIENNSLYETEYDYDYEENSYLSGIDDEIAKKDLLEILKGE